MTERGWRFQEADILKIVAEWIDRTIVTIFSLKVDIFLPLKVTKFEPERALFIASTEEKGYRFTDQELSREEVNNYQKYVEKVDIKEAEKDKNSLCLTEPSCSKCKKKLTLQLFDQAVARGYF